MACPASWGRLQIQQQLQCQIAAAQGQVGIKLGGPGPDSGPGLSLIKIFTGHAQHQDQLNKKEDEARADGFHASPPVSMAATIRRRVSSSAQPPARKRAPRTISPRERSSLFMTLEK